jgi:hemolysin III
MAALDASGRPKPRLRGRLHEVAFFASLPACAALVSVASTTTARVAAIVYSLSLVAMFGTSAIYHRGRWTGPALLRMQRLDHAMIFILIAATYTPFAILALEEPWSHWILASVWAGAVLGITLKLFAVPGAGAIGATLYIVLGWLAVVVLPQFLRGVSAPAMALVLAGGVLYTVGSIVLLLNRPDPNPSVFGYHEVFHSLTIAASSCHFAAVMLVILALA